MKMSLSLIYHKLVKADLKLQSRQKSLPQRRKQEGATALIVAGWAKLWGDREASRGFTARVLRVLSCGKRKEEI